MNLLARRRVLLDYLAGALWVLPTVSVVVFLLAGAVLSRVEVDQDSPWATLAFQGTADDARSLLIVVSSTMITVTGLVFALTIVALQIASGQYSPRLLRNFMRDRGTQLVLSIFVGAFAYSTAGLYTVGVQGSGQEAFVPRLAVSGSLALALASVGVLIYFIHHLARSIQIDTIMSQVEREASAVIDEVYPHQPGYREAEERCPEPPLVAVGLPSARSGYIQAVDPDPLVRTAVRHGVVVVVARQVGDHVVAGTPIAWAWGRTAGQPPPGAGTLREAVDEAVQVGFERTMVQDVGFGIRRLVDIANKALSPAVNDPYTGVQAVHHLSVLLCSLARLRLGDWIVRDDQGELRVAVPRPKFPTTCGSDRPDPPVRGRRAGRDPCPDRPAPRRRHQLGHRGPAPRLRPPYPAGPGRRPPGHRPARRCRGGDRRGAAALRLLGVDPSDVLADRPS
jgi:uncharacterized membrane protein